MGRTSPNGGNPIRNAGNTQPASYHNRKSGSVPQPVPGPYRCLYALRWESARGRSGYSPACGNEWKPGVCNKPRVKCGDCDQRLLLPVTDQVIHDHLAGQHTVGVYSLMADDTCCFLAVDLDDADWREDARALMQSCHELNISAALEISRSGNGAHVWIFFSDSVPAREARQLGAALISYTCNRTHQLSLSSYDRFFPNQDTLPKGGFGNLIVLPLQKQPRERGFSVFVDVNYLPYPDQWAFLASIAPMPRFEVENAILRATGGRHPLDVAFVAEEDEHKPWQRPTPVSNEISGPLPESLKLVLANQIFIAKADLPQPLVNRLIRLAAFQNPEFYRAQAMRMSVWNKPRIIGCAENFPEHIGLPRGCLEALQELLKENNIQAEIQDERVGRNEVAVKFIGKLRKDQKTAVRAMLKQNVGVLCAPAAFGKTVRAAALIAQRKVSTMVLVHRTNLLRQWQERVTAFLELPKGTLGLIGGGKKKPTGKIDIAVMQSLSRREDLPELLDGYGQIIVDECHHVSDHLYAMRPDSTQGPTSGKPSGALGGLAAKPVRSRDSSGVGYSGCVPHPCQRHKPQPANGPGYPGLGIAYLVERNTATVRGTCASMTTSNATSLNLPGCGTNVSAAIGPWAIRSDKCEAWRPHSAQLMSLSLRRFHLFETQLDLHTVAGSAILSNDENRHLYRHIRPGSERGRHRHSDDDP